MQRPKTEEFGFELSHLYVTKEDLVEVSCYKFKAELRPAGLDALMHDAQLHSAKRQLRQTQ